jgi:uncharacterized protein with HEPN domain
VPRDHRVLLDDITAACLRIEQYTKGLTFEQFREDDMRMDAVVRNLEVIGEAAKKLPSESRAAMPEVPWQRIAGLRDVLIHAYFGIDAEIIWDVVTTTIPDLLSSGDPRTRATGISRGITKGKTCYAFPGPVS